MNSGAGTVAAYKHGLDVLCWEKDSLRKGEETTNPPPDKEIICYGEDHLHAWGIFDVLLYL